MANCPFPVIPAYLAEQVWPADQLDELSVTHVWTQDKAISQNIASAARIPNVVDDLADMIGRVDAVLLARDDPENHVTMALPFLEAGVPIYVDKPLAVTQVEGDLLFDMASEPHHLFSCSALAYSPELWLSAVDREKIGSICCVDAVVPKSWEKYAVHVLEPAINLLDVDSPPIDHRVLRNEGMVAASFSFSTGQLLTVKTMGKVSAPLELHVYGEQGHRTLTFTNSFTAFKNALAAFARQLRTKEMQIERQRTMSVVRLLELGLPNQ